MTRARVGPSGKRGRSAGENSIVATGARRLDEAESVTRIGSYALDIPADRWVSSRGLDAVLGIDAGYDRTIAGWAGLIHPDDREGMVGYLNEKVLGGSQPFDRQYRIIRPDDGAERWVHGRGTLEFDAAARPARLVGTIADVTNQRQAQLALIASELRYATIFEGAAEAILIAELATRRFCWVNPAACTLLGYTRAELLQLTIGDIHPATDLSEILPQFLSEGDDAPTEARSVPCVRADGTVLLADIRSSTAIVDGVVCRIGFFTDVTELRRLEIQDRKLAAAVEQTTDSVMIADLTGTIEYVNPAFERASGYSRDEAVGANPRILKSGRQSAAFYRALWRRLVAGQTWSGTLINRRKDGALYEEEATISPMRGPGGEIAGYVAVKRDVTSLRAAESGLSRQFRERAEVAAALARIQPAESAEATAAVICDELVGLADVDLAAIINFVDPKRAVTLAVAESNGLRVAPGRALPVTRAKYLYERAAQGPWAEVWKARPGDGRLGEAVAELGIRAIAYAPISNGEGLLGVVAAATRDEAFARHLIDHLPAVGEFAATASALLSGSLERGHRDERTRERIRRILARAAFGPVFQPIVDLATGAAVGFEALTRFDDDTPPDQQIADAHAVGLGLELEAACLAAALEASVGLPASAWLSLNVSPDMILDPEALPRLLAGRTRRIVLEVTEHAEIDDYLPIRQVVRGFGPTISMAVDDAGAGFASLRHVVELAPRFVKIDISLVRGVDRDLTRQAMVAGLRHFAGRVGCEVIAEGIENDAELQILRELDIPLGQGYLLGRPEARVQSELVR
jgi:PAS domain S-box-containing protein